MQTILTYLSRTLRATALASAVLIAPATAQTATWQWGLQSTNPTPTDGSLCDGNDVATDAAGRVYVGGVAEGFQSTMLATRSFGSAGSIGPGRNGFIAQATAAGSWAWLAPATALGADDSGETSATVTAVAVAAAGDVYAAGFARGSSLRIGTVSQALPGTGRSMWVARLNSSGVCQWVRVVESLPSHPKLAYDPSTGGVALASTYYGAVSFGTFALPAPGSGSALCVARLSPAGQWQHASGVTGTANLISQVSVAVGPAGQVAVAGAQRTGTLTFGAQSLTAPAGADASFFVAQLSPANQWQWAVGSSTAPGTSTSNSAIIAFGVAYTPGGAVWISGRGTGGTTVGPATLAVVAGSGSTSYAGFVGQLSASGQWGTVQPVGASVPGLVAIGPLRTDGNGNAVVVGGLRGYSSAATAALGSTTLSAPANGLLLFTASLNSTGQWRYIGAMPTPAVLGGLNPVALALDGAGNAYVTGGLSGALTVGSSMLNGSFNPNSGNGFPGSDAMLLRQSNATVTAGRAAAAGSLALALSPNPARDLVTLRFPADGPAPGVVTVLDALGRTVLRVPVAAHAAAATLSVAGLAAGLYTVRAGAATGRLEVE
ncbi:hypothetical protein [Hymenobacter saemangeumensis]